MTSRWIPTLGYDVAKVDGKVLVLVRGGDYYGPGLATDELPAWRVYAITTDLDNARKIARALNLTVEPQP